MLPFIYDGDDNNLPFANGDYIFVPAIAEAIKDKKESCKAYVIKGDALVECEFGLGRLTDDERDIILNGCLIKMCIRDRTYTAQIQAG